MDIVALFETTFWAVATNAVKLMVPITALFCLMRLIHDILYKD